MESSVVNIPKGKKFIEKEMKVLAIILFVLAIFSYILSSISIYYFHGNLLEEDIIGRQLLLISIPSSVVILYFMYKLKEVTGFKVLFYWTLIYTVYNIIGIFFYGNPLGFTSSRNNSFNGAILLWIYLPLIFLAFYRNESRIIKVYFVSMLFLSTAFSPFTYYNSFSYYTEFYLRNYISVQGVYFLTQRYFNYFLFFGIVNALILIRIYYSYKKHEYVEENTVITGDFSDFMKLREKKLKEKALNS